MSRLVRLPPPHEPPTTEAEIAGARLPPAAPLQMWQPPCFPDPEHWSHFCKIPRQLRAFKATLEPDWPDGVELGTFCPGGSLLWAEPVGAQTIVVLLGSFGLFSVKLVDAEAPLGRFLLQRPRDTRPRRPASPMPSSPTTSPR